MVLDTIKLVIHPAMEVVSRQSGGSKATCLINRILKLQVMVSITKADNIQTWTYSIHQDCTCDDQTLSPCIRKVYLQSGSMYFIIIGLTRHHLSPAVKNTGTLGG